MHVHILHAFFANQKFLAHYYPAYDCIQNLLSTWSGINASCQNVKHVGVLAIFAHNSSCLYLLVIVLLNWALCLNSW